MRLDVLASSAATVTAPASIVVRRAPRNDADAVGQIAAELDRLADATSARLARARALIDSLGNEWIGFGFTAAGVPCDRLMVDTEQTIRVLREVAAALRQLAARLHAAAHEHASWLRRLDVLGAVVAIGAVAITIEVATDGAATAAVVAGVRAAAAALETAAATARTVAAGADAIAAIARALRALEPLWEFLRPLVVAQGIVTLGQASSQLLKFHRIDVRTLAYDSLVGFVTQMVQKTLEPAEPRLLSGR